MEEQVELILNNRGENFTVVVDIETANILLNDPIEADKYIESILEKRTCASLNTGLATALPSTSKGLQSSTLRGAQTEENRTCTLPGAGIISELPTTGTNNKENSLENININTKVWTHKRPTDLDIEATEVFLQLRKKFSGQFDDRKSVKSQLWLKIGQQMNEMGFYIGDGKEAIEKLRLKFSNLQKQYLTHLKHMTSTGERQKDPPQFYDLLHDILGTKDKCNPSHLQDTIENEDKNDDSTEEDHTVSEIKNRFSSQYQGHTEKSKSINAQFLEMAKRESQERRSHFSKIENILEVQNAQRERLLGQIDQLIKIELKKRKRDQSSDESD